MLTKKLLFLFWEKFLNFQWNYICLFCRERAWAIESKVQNIWIFGMFSPVFIKKDVILPPWNILCHLDFYRSCIVIMTHVTEWFPEFLGNHQKNFEFSLKFWNWYSCYLTVLVSSLKWSSLFEMSSNRLSESGDTFVLSLLHWLSKQPIIWSCLFYSVVELTWPRMVIKSVHVCMYYGSHGGLPECRWQFDLCWILDQAAY